jgi:hypothetical protein
MKLLTDEEIVAIAKQYSGDKSDVEFWFARAIEAAIIAKLGEPVGYISNEAIYRLEHGGNSKKQGVVPIHKTKSVASKTPLYQLPEVKE